MNQIKPFLGPVAMKPRLGQEFITSYDQGVSEDVPGLTTTYDQGSAMPVPGLTTSYDQGTSSPVPGLVSSYDQLQSPVVPDQKPAGMSDTDWAKLLGSALTAASSGYSTYSKAEVAKINAQAAALRASNPAAAALLPDLGMSTGTLVALGALGVGAILFIVALT